MIRAILEASIRRGTFTSTFAALLVGATASVFVPSAIAEDKQEKPIKALLVCGGGYHDYGKQKDIISKGIAARANVEFTIANGPDKVMNPLYENADWAKGFDVIIHDECTADVKDLAVIERILKPHKDGLPAIILHCGMHCYRSDGWNKKELTPWMALTGLQTTGHGKQIPIEIKFVDKDSALTKGLADWTTGNEELYNNIVGNVADTAKPLAHGKQITKDKDGKEKVDETIVVWTNTYNGKTKVFGTTIGHNNVTCEDPRYLDMITRGLLWSVDKLDDAHLKKVAAK